MSKGTKVLL